MKSSLLGEPLLDLVHPGAVNGRKASGTVDASRAGSNDLAVVHADVVRDEPELDIGGIRDVAPRPLWLIATTSSGRQIPFAWTRPPET